MLDQLGNLKRTHYCGELRASDAEKDVVLMGWVHRRRDLGQLIFIDLRDREGIAQIVFNKEQHPTAHAKAEELRSEYVVAVKGRVLKRGKPNPEIATGEVEIAASELLLLNNAKTPPFVVEDEVNASEETRLRYRYLDLRRPKPHKNLALRHRVILEIRKALDEIGFYEVETPMLTRSTPEGARDYLVPSRVHHGQFYALPQSPQIFKQILMISGLDRYFQIVKCFRDEDLRADRQPEFTQLDLEMSFPRQQDIFETIEHVMTRACAVAGVNVKGPFRHLDYHEALRRYGSDKPDLRFGMELQNVTPFFEGARETLHFEGNVQAIVAPGAAAFSRKQLDELSEYAKSAGAKAVYTAKVTAEGVTSSLEKTLGAEKLKELAAAVGAKPGDLIVAATAKEQVPHSDTSLGVAGQLRLHLGDKLNLIDRTRWEFLWITGFALFRMERIGQSLGERAASVHRNCGRRSRQARDRAVGMPVEGLRSRAEWRRAWLRQHSNSPAGYSRAHVQGAGVDAGAAAAALRIFSRCADVWNAAAWRNRAGNRSRGDAARGREIDPRSCGVSEDDCGAGFDGRFAEQS